MHIRFGFEIEIDCMAPVPLVLALSTYGDERHRLIGCDSVRSEPAIESSEYRDTYGNRMTRVVAPGGRTLLWSDCVAETSPEPDEVAPDAMQHPVEDLPSEVLRFLMPSRYCDSDLLVQQAWDLFGGIQGGWARVQAIVDYTHRQIAFGYSFGRSDKTASDANREGRGVCRDYAHLAISLCRAMNIPARYCSGYLGDIGVPYAGPADFCAWFEVYLGGRWYTFDARYNVPRIGRIVMVRGADAGDVAMITSFGSYRLHYFRVWCDELPAGLSDGDIHALLAGPRPGGEALVFPVNAAMG